MTFVASTQAASAPQALGQSRVRSSWAAVIAAGSAPITGISMPVRESSPRATVPATSSCGSTSRAASSASAMGRSKCEPSLGMSAGERLTVIRFDGSAMESALSAAFTRSRASLTALSGRPTMAKAGMPGETAHCTSTGRASTPSKATV